jgi:hypothetical protein
MVAKWLVNIDIFMNWPSFPVELGCNSQMYCIVGIWLAFSWLSKVVKKQFSQDEQNM